MNETNMAASPNGMTEGKALWVEAKDAVAQVADSASEKVKRELSARKEKAAERAGAVASALRETGHGLRDVGPLPDLADQAADQIEKLASYVQNKNLGDLVREVERFARRDPALFLGGSLALGLLAGRFLKSSVRTGESAGNGRDQHRPDIEVRTANPIRSAVSEGDATQSSAWSASETASSSLPTSQNGTSSGTSHANRGK